MPIKKHPNTFINKILTGKNDSEGCILIPTKYLNKDPIAPPNAINK